MTNQSPLIPLRDIMTDSLSGQTLVVADDHFIDELRADARGVLASAVLHPAAAALPIPDSLIRHARVIVLEVDATNDASLRRLASIRANHPDVSIVAALRNADLTLVRALIRQGVVDVTELPFVPGQLEDQVLDAYASIAKNSAVSDQARTVTVVGAIGGSGATTLLTHLASAIAKKNAGHKGVCLVDLDLQKGTVASYLRLEPKVSMQALLDAGSRLDRDLVLSAVTETNLGFSVIAAPDSIAPADHLDVDHVVATMRLIQSSFDYVLFDLPPMWTNWSLSIAGWSNQILLATDTSISSLRQAKRTLSLLQSLEVPASRMGIVANRVERGMFKAMRTDDIEQVLGASVMATVADAGSPLRAAQDEGLLLSATHGKTKFSSDVASLADAIMAGGAVT